MGDCFGRNSKRLYLVTVCAGLAPSVVAKPLAYLLWLLSARSDHSVSPLECESGTWLKILSTASNAPSI